MAYSLEEIKRDLYSLDVKQFYMKHIVRTENWYFENILNIPPNELVSAVDDFRIIVSSSLGVSYNSVMMVGSGKTGFSLSPKKRFKAFNISPDAKDKSDIDIAIISQPIFDRLWKLFRDSYSVTNEYTYKFISREVYRGYINERNINGIDETRKVWKETSALANRNLQQKMYFKHDISYRIYRSWEDFEEYNIFSIKDLKREVCENVK